MSTLMLACAMILVPSDERSARRALDESESEARAYHEINDDLKRLTRSESLQKDVNPWVGTVRQMCKLYVEIMQHPKLNTSDTLQSYRVKLRRRLLTIQTKLERQLARADGPSRPAVAPQAAQLAGQMNESMSALLAMSGSSLGGPTQLLSYGGSGSSGARGGAPRLGDYGPDLVDLIQRTISPDFWDINGGPGTIVYYPQWYALVVRATAEVHHKIGGVLGGVRRAGN